MTRDQKIAWIEKAKGELEKAYYRIKTDYLWSRNTEIVYDIMERDPADDDGAFLESWHDSANDHLIEKIDWSEFNLCRECEEIFEPTHSDDEFCGDECEGVYEYYKATGGEKEDFGGNDE